MVTNELTKAGFRVDFIEEHEIKKQIIANKPIHEIPTIFSWILENAFFEIEVEK